MKKTLGIVLVIIGIIMITFTGFNFVTTEKVVDLGPIQINAEKNHLVNWPTIVGAVFLLGGTMIIFTNRKAHV
ncbi:MAG: hypothetical protein KFF73_13000 [Cyclobacteriaceae bacterium]|nr:hypothetical protein [Cyclobacteriaceae bacterium]